MVNLLKEHFFFYPSQFDIYFLTVVSTPTPSASLFVKISDKFPAYN